jgi:hypothetical protein
MYSLARSLNWSGQQGLRPLLRDHVAPTFFSLYPDGKIAVVRSTLEYENAAALERILYAGAQTPLQEIKQGGQGIGTLQDWHLNSMGKISPLVLGLFTHLFYPFIGGIRGGPLGLDFLFLFEPAERYTPAPSPHNWLEAATAAASFGRERVNVLEVLQDYTGPAGQHLEHQRFRAATGYTVSERVKLLEWYVERVNRLLYEMTDVANFTSDRDPESPIDPVFAFEHHLTVDRLARKTLLSMSLEEVGTTRFMAFEVADLYDMLSHLFQGTPTTDFFKDLFHPVGGPALLRDRLAQLPAPFGTDLPALVDQLYQRIQQTIIGSVWLQAKVTASNVLVRDKSLANDKALSHEDFVAEVMRCYRNGHHGYFTTSDRQSRPSRYLYLVNGNLPAEISALPALWWLAYLSDPKMVGWKWLPLGHFEV